MSFYGFLLTIPDDRLYRLRRQTKNMDEDGVSFVVSDKLGRSVDKADLYDRLGPDVRLGTWEYFLSHSVDFDVLILDMDLSNYTSEVGHGVSETQLTENKESFFDFFKLFESDISYFLESGDTVIVLLYSSIPAVKSQMGGREQRVYSDQWLDSLSVLENRKYESDSPPTVDSELEPVQEYFHAVSGHYELEVNYTVVQQPDILAKAADENYPAGFATNQFIDDTGSRVESEGTLILLPQPKSLTKSHRIVEQLVELGWEYHSDERPEPQSPEKETGSMQLSTSIEEFDDELVEHCFSKYARGEYADAATKALKILDNRLKETVGDEIDYSSTADLMKKAFRPSEGPLRMGEKPGEEEGVMFLYAGAIQGLRNPLSHRVVDPEKERYLDDFDQQKAHDIIAYVNLLLSLIENNEPEEKEN